MKFSFNFMFAAMLMAQMIFTPNPVSKQKETDQSGRLACGSCRA